MQKRSLQPQTRSFLAGLVVFAVASAQAGVQSMHRVNSQAGWAATGQQVFWTTDAGLHWKDITPQTAPGVTVASVFFLDDSNGWVLLATDGLSGQETRFDLAATTDSGAHWSIAGLEVPSVDPARGLSKRAWITFVDSQHGWAMARMNGNTAVSIGVLLATADGGRTWRSPAHGPPVAGALHFLDPQRGWLAGGPEDKLYLTQDGGLSWLETALPPPAPLHSSAQATYSLPVFEDSRHGNLTVTFSGPDDPRQVQATYTSGDGGLTWASDHTTTVEIPSASPADNPGGPGQAGFADNMRGWALAGGKLLSAAGGGAGWADITPPPARDGNPAAQRVVAAKQAPRFLGKVSAAPTTYTTHVGFDKSRVLSPTEMETWWNSSPFWDYALYLPGSPNRGHDVNLTPAWVAAAQTIGWGFIPTWFGPQPPCACGPGSTPGNCIPFSKAISSDPGTAERQGVAQADAALQAATKLGVSPNIIYQDIEFYTPTTQCSAAVVAYLNGWDGELHLSGVLAGAYGPPVPAQQDFSRVPLLPDDVWITRNDSRVTIWGLGSLSDSLWPENQRIHQYQLEVTMSWGGTASYQIDPDIEDATILAGNGSKSYNFTFQSVDPPGGTFPFLTGINNINSSSGGLMTGSGQIGQIVGHDTSNATDNDVSFLYSAGQFRQIIVPGSTFTVATGLNDTGQIVGYYQDGATLFFHGFVDHANRFTSIDVPGAVITGAIGVNDANQIIGYDEPPPPSVVGYFLDKTGVFTSLPDYPGAEPGNTSALAVNGQGQIMGYSGGITFLYNPSDGTFRALQFGTDPGVAFGTAINNNGQVVGYYQDSSTNSTRGFLFDAGSNTFVPIDFPGALGTFPAGINDAGQIVGSYEDPGVNPIHHTFIATP